MRAASKLNNIRITLRNAQLRFQLASRNFMIPDQLQDVVDVWVDQLVLYTPQLRKANN